MTVSPLSLQPKDAIAFFRSKGMRRGFDYRDVWQQEHAQAFTVAKAMQVDILTDIRQALDDALVQGQTFEQFKKQLAPILQAKGWWGKKAMVDPKTGETVLAQLGSDRRLKTIFQTNMRAAFNAGNWQRSWAVRSVLPYMIYHHNSEIAPRPEHQAWDLVCLRTDDPWWNTHYPQCAWGCKCTTESVSRRMLEERGLKITVSPPKFDMVEYVNPRTGEVSQVEQGIDPAFNFNVGKAPLRPITARPARVVQDRPVKDIAATTRPFFEAAGVDPEKGTIVKDKSGWPLAINDRLFHDLSGKPALPSADVAALPQVAQALKSPDRAEWLWSSAIREASNVAAIERIVAALPGDGRAVERLSPLESWLVKRAGVADHRIRATEARHALIEHGDALKEAARGQVALEAGDFQAVPEIARSPDVMILGMKDKRGQAAVTFIKERAADTVVYTATVSPGKRQLVFKTMWKRPAGTDAKVLANSLSQHARNGGGDAPEIVDLRGNIKAPRDELVRRYTKRLDKQEVTVDFSAGTWTYQVRPLSGD